MGIVTAFMLPGTSYFRKMCSCRGGAAEGGVALRWSVGAPHEDLSSAGGEFEASQVEREQDARCERQGRDPKGLRREGKERRESGESVTSEKVARNVSTTG